MATTSTQYQSYLLRLWSTGGNSKLRATLVSVHNPDQQHHFATLDELTLFLNEAVFQRNAIDDVGGAAGEIDEEGDVEHRGYHRYRTE